MTDWPDRPVSIGQAPLAVGICAPPAPITLDPLLLPETELDPDDAPELLLDVDSLPPELLLPTPELEPLLLLVAWTPLLLVEPEEPLPEDALLVGLLPELLFAPLPEPLLLALPPLLELPVDAALVVVPVEPLLPPNGMFHMLFCVLGELPQSQAPAARAATSHGGAIQPIFLMVTSSNRRPARAHTRDRGFYRPPDGNATLCSTT